MKEKLMVLFTQMRATIAMIENTPQAYLAVMPLDDLACAQEEVNALPDDAPAPAADQGGLQG
jgi:hypothetical protein